MTSDWRVAIMLEAISRTREEPASSWTQLREHSINPLYFVLSHNSVHRSLPLTGHVEVFISHQLLYSLIAIAHTYYVTASIHSRQAQRLYISTHPKPN
jgi:hypothetical protein